MTATVNRHRFDPDVVQQIGRLDLIAHMLADGVLQGLRRARRHGFSTEFSDFKPYVPGDDLRLLDWRVYARTDRLFVRRYEAETNLENRIVLDATASMAWQWQTALTKLQYGANLLATIACLAMRQQDRVGLYVHDARDLHYLPPRSGRNHLEHIFSVFEGVDPSGAACFPHLIESVAATRRHRGLIVLCSDLEEGQDEISAALQALAGTEDSVLLFHILDRAEIDLPFDRATHLEDSETGARLSVDLPALKKHHARTVRDFREEWRSRCRHLDIGYIPIDTGMNYVDVLLQASEVLA